MSPRVRSPRGHTDELREEILAATEALLLETGSEDAVSIRGVADAVGVTAPTIYRHFEDKQALLFAVCDRQFTRFHEELAAERAMFDDPLDALMACGRAYVRFGQAHPEHYRIMFMGHSDWTPEQYADEILAEHGSFYGIVEAVQATIDAGQLDADDAFPPAVLLWSAMHGLTSLLISKPNFPWPPVDQLVDTILGTWRKGFFAAP